MKRTVLVIVTMTITLFVAASTAMAQPLAPSVPPLINLQGRATDNVGNPVSDGAHTFTFRIFNVSVAGAALWTEGPLGVTTSGGLFTHQLGSSTPLPIGGFIGGFFQDENQLWLEIEVDGNIISPRTQLISNPYTQVANMVETEPQNGIGIVTVRIPTPLTDCHISTYGIGGLQKSQLGNCAWGEFMLMDFTPETTATLTANPGGGGELRLTDGGGLTTIDLHGGLLGDASVVVPVDAVNSGEILDEPGIASTYKNTTIAMGVVTDFDTISITAPTGGYIVVNGYGYVQFNHTNGTEDRARFSISTTAGSIDFDNFSIHTWPAVAATGTAWSTFAITKVEAVGAGVQTYYLNGDELVGNVSIGRPRMTAMFFPTNYGTVVSTKPVVSRTTGNVVASADAVGSDLPSEVEVTTVEDHNARLEAERTKQIADLEARIRTLEAQANTDRLPERGMVGPRKER